MRFRIEKNKKSDIDLTPILDMMFIILIFFMVAATFDLNRSIKVSLPKSFAGESSIEKNKIIIEVDREGKISVNGNIVDILELSNEIKSFDNYKESTVYLLGDDEANYRDIIEIIDILKLLEITDISLVTEKREGL
ncbi:MAG TPA: biopolymer transporter ExbD [Spirochaetota bacterium]|nr:biopolymer transporter ExbD [Spirochaetota bacterium]HOL57732.1 biopolymer transporter ExbD [Spirochaetota bacterium]HPP05298.1 biopolymer transporter ExbD [Spirochaetota bacterium]